MGDDRKTVLDGGRRYQGIGQLDRAVDTSHTAVGHESGPRPHHGLADGDGIGAPSQRERVRPARSHKRVGDSGRYGSQRTWPTRESVAEFVAISAVRVAT